jgi:catechol 2,3-dioxygenase-like lactoylglutathione lyase family enzyme
MKRAFGLLVLCTVAGIAGVRAASETTAPYLAENSMNVFRRFSAERAKMLEFYGEALGTKAMAGFANVGGDGGMSRFLVGTSQLKFTTGPRGAKYPTGNVRDVRGLRVWTLFFTDQAALTARLTQHGIAVPEFKQIAETRRALVTDPDGQWVELVIVPPSDPTALTRLEVGITAGDLERSRAFYREFVGLEELPPVRDALLGVMKYPFRHGTTTVNVWAAAPGAEKAATNKGGAGIQYVVNNVEAVNTLALARNVPVEQPLADTLPGLRTVWLFDPDDVTNYFAQIVPRSSAR